ncbi:MAG: MaoC family dehydratase [Sphingomonadales bacterium]
MPTILASDLQSYVGKETGLSDWIEITQPDVNAFADVTRDHQFIHVDVEKAKESPFGGTIAHGFLTLSLLSGFADGTTLALDGAKMGVNYGLEKVRFLAPVKVGKRIRGRFVLAEANERKPGVFQMIYEASGDIEGEDKPALSAQWIVLQYI